MVDFVSKYNIIGGVILVLFLMKVSEGRARTMNNTDLSLIPLPKNIVYQKGYFELTDETSWVVMGEESREELNKIVTYFNRKIQQSTGYVLSVKLFGNENVIRIKVDKTLKLKDEGYRLEVSSGRITVKGKTAQGVFYGIQTVMQLFPSQIESNLKIETIAWKAPCVIINDEPVYPYRGMLLDVGRHFHSVEFIKKQLDIMAMLKMNRFHWHLTDDQLWTIEIKKYPRLTEVGAVRRNADGTIHRGFYTQEQIKEVVAYAAERYITVIPEIEMPGHALAVLTAYPEYSCTGGPFSIRNMWGVEEDVYCAGNDKTFEFLENILSEVAVLFPGKMIHIGGDECPKDRWSVCPKCRKRIRDENLKDVNGLQSYFIRRIEKFLLSHGKSMIGWDEILEGGLAPSATVMSWRGEKGGITAATMGHDVIMTPSKWMYIDAGQGAVEVEPIAIDVGKMLDSVYEYDPASEKIPKELRHHVLGAQANMWTEYATTPEYTEYLLYPRLLAVAELNWTPKVKKNYDSFVQRLNGLLMRLDYHHVNYHIPLPEGPAADYVAFTDKTVLNFHNSRNLPMVYTLDGSEPTLSSTLYRMPIVLDKKTVFKIASVLPFGKLSPVRTIHVVKEKYSPRIDKDTKVGLNLWRTEGDLYYVHDVKDAYWTGPDIVPGFDFKPLLEDKGAYCYTGYFEVPTDGIYFFSTEMDELWIDGKVVLSNDGKLVRHSCTRTSMALQKGKHSFRLLMINNNIGGYLRLWNEKGFRIALEGQDLSLPLNEILSH